MGLEEVAHPRRPDLYRETPPNLRIWHYRVLCCRDTLIVGALSRGVGGPSRWHSFQHRFLLDMGERQVCRVERSFSGLRSFGVCGGSRRVLSPRRMPVHAPIHLSADLSVLVLSTRNDALFGGLHDVGDCHTTSLPGDRLDGHSPRGCCPCSDHAGGGEKYSAGPYGVLFPLALLASRNWPALASATATGGMLGLAAAFAFGSHDWPAFIDTLFDRNAGLSPDQEVALSLQSVYSLLYWAGAGTTIAWTVQVGAAMLVALAIAITWAKPIALRLKAALLCASSVIVTPYVLAYDLCILSIAAAFLVSEGLSSGFLPGERVVILVCWGILFLPAAPLAPFTCAALIFLIVRRIVASQRKNVARSVASPSAGCGSVISNM